MQLNSRRTGKAARSDLERSDAVHDVRCSAYVNPSVYSSDRRVQMSGNKLGTVVRRPQTFADVFGVCRMPEWMGSPLDLIPTG